MDDMHAVVTNSTVDGVLAAFFAILIIVVIADAARVCVETLRRREPALSEVPAEESQLWAPSGLFPTAEDRARQAELRPEPVGAGRERSGGLGSGGPDRSGGDG